LSLPLAGQPNLSAKYRAGQEALPPGVYLLSVHLGFNDEELQAMTWDHPDWGAQWRQNDYDVISSPAFHKFLKDHGFILVNWKDLQKAVQSQH
jgi:chitin disaccharide deacetylase